MDKLKQGVFVNTIKESTEFIGDHRDDVLLTKYSDVIKGIKRTVEHLANLEELILQARHIYNLNNIKLSFLREYVYARAPFFRRNKASKDIRVLVGRIDLIYPNHKNPSLDKLYHDTIFMDKAKNKLILTMNDELTKNYKNYWDNY